MQIRAPVSARYAPVLGTGLLWLAVALGVARGAKGLVGALLLALIGSVVVLRARRSAPPPPAQTRERAHLADLQRLVKASAALQSETRRGAALDLVARQACMLLHADGAVVHLADPEGSFVTTAAFGASVPELDPTDLLVRDVLEQGRVVPFSIGRASTLLVPLTGTVRRHGLLALAGPRDGSWLDPFTLELARLYGSQVGIALDRLKVIEGLTRETMRDPLTGVGNRRRASELLSSLAPGDAVLLIDLDRFKEVNDTDGHVAGDAVLVSLASYLRDNLRDDDAVARYGGEEFLIVLRDVGEDAGRAAERLWSGWRDGWPRTTFSVGVASQKEEGAPSRTFLRADAALLRAKRQGRDRVVVDERRCDHEEEVTDGELVVLDRLPDGVTEGGRPELLPETEIRSAEA